MAVSENYNLKKRTIILGYLTQFFQYGAGFIVLPVILNKLDADDLGLWYLFLSISSIVSLLDFGFSGSIQRNVAYVYSGASTLLEDGYVPTNKGKIDYYLLKSLIFTSKRIYKYVAIGVLVLSSTFGSLYLYYTVQQEIDLIKVCTWFLFVITTSINFYYTYILSILKGKGLIDDYNLNIIISKILYILVLYFGVISGWGLFALVVGNLVNIISMVILGKIKYLSANEKKILNNRKIESENLFPILWKNARNSGIVNIGVLLLSQAGVILSGIFLPLEDVAKLGLILQIFGIIVVLSRVYLMTVMPKLSSMWITDTKSNIAKLFLKSQLIGYVIFFTSVLFLVLLGDYILINIIHSKVMLPSVTVILLYTFFYFMEITHGNCCSLISTSNNIPFTRASITSGVVSIVVTVILLNMNIGIVSFPLGLICGSLPYNSWKWPLVTYKILTNKKNK